MNRLATVSRRLLPVLLAAAALAATAGEPPVLPGPRTDGAWDRLANCRLLPDRHFDGDSFYVEHDGRQFLFRLYFADACETDARYSDRIGDQAAYFSIGTNDVLRLGELARDFTGRRLDKPFTVITRWQNARGQGSLPRAYAIVLSGGENLSRLLVEAGLARIQQPYANWPDSPRSARFLAELKAVELEAKVAGRGAWNTNRFARVAHLSAPAPARDPASRLLVDLNEATPTELDALPGIGPKLAERIIAGRPYTSVDELEKVRGIGTNLLERLRPAITVTPEASRPVD
ncbi:MAG: helix-hairpin-helix domain-containing protein [Limisphaerales bacterium]